MSGNKRTGLFEQLIFALLIGFGSAMAVAEDATVVYDRYSLHVSAEAEVENDLMVVMLVVEDEDSNSAALADRINQVMLWALLETEKYPSIKAATRDYRTYPKYDQNRITGWRSSQALRLEGSDIESVKMAVAELQQQLIVRSMQFLPREETRRQAENDLVDDALERFRDRADLIRTSMQAEEYRVIQISVNTGDIGRPAYRMEAMAMDTRGAAKSVAAPAVEAGSSKIQISVSGEIQLQ